VHEADDDTSEEESDADADLVLLCGGLGRHTGSEAVCGVTAAEDGVLVAAEDPAAAGGEVAVVGVEVSVVVVVASEHAVSCEEDAAGLRSNASCGGKGGALKEKVGVGVSCVIPQADVAVMLGTSFAGAAR
jgi:hypothetical protein